MKKTSPSKRAVIKIVNGYIDLASIAKNVPELDMIIGDEKITLVKKWTVRGIVRRCAIDVHRYVSAGLFSEFLGLYASDGSKKSSRFRFSNVNLQYHKKVADVLRFLGARKMLAYVYTNISDARRLNRLVRRFEALTGAKVRGIYFDDRAKNPLFELDVCSKPLAIFLLTAERLFRKDAVAGRLPRSLVARYLRGVIEGDGNIRLRASKRVRYGEEGAGGFYLRISERNKEVAKDFAIILQKYYGLQLHTYGYDHVATLNLQHILDLLHDEMFPEKYRDKLRRRLLIAFKRRGIPWILLRLLETFGDNTFSTSQASEVLNKSRNHARESLMTLTRMGFLKSWRKKILERRKGTPIRRIFKPTRKAFKTAKILHTLLSPHSFPFSHFPKLSCFMSKSTRLIRLT